MGERLQAGEKLFAELVFYSAKVLVLGVFFVRLMNWDSGVGDEDWNL